MTDYSVLVIDPPWPKKKGGLRALYPRQGRNLDYSTLSVEEIFSLLDTEILPLASPLHTVFLWSVDEFLHAGESAMAARGYRRHARLIWDKMNGVAPGFSVRYCHEYVTWFYKPKFTPVAKESRGKISTVFRERSREHSRKPDCVYRAIETWYPSENKIDVFSREQRNGWSQWGDQVDHFNRDEL